ncbi:NOT2/NOT3/NOT5 [Trinorchestia longiramus]|nr:NOT2/NOT3/NOT5 [Trinorchestia longiramus]
MTNNVPPYQQRSSVNDVLQQIHRLNPMGGLMGRGSSGYNPSNSGSTILSHLNASFSGTSGGGGFGGGNFPSSAADTAPSPLDLSEFPSLSRSSGVVGDPMSVGGTHGGGRTSYGSLGHGWGGMVKQPVSEPSEFTMSSEDFPALPGSHMSKAKQQHSDAFGGDTKKSGGASNSSSAAGAGAAGNNSTVASNSAGGVNSSAGSGDLSADGRGGASAADKANQSKKGIQTSPDGKVTNIPAGMVRDQFGMVGLLTFIRAAESDNNLVTLALGSDLTGLGLNLNSPDNLYPNFGGPWADSPCRPQDIDYHVPQEYLVNQQISMYGRAGKLAPIQFDRYGEDLLFYMFYSNAGDVWQLMAAAELYNRDWRYHKEERVWLTRAPGMPPVEKAHTYERGTYFYFDVTNWRKVPKEFHLEYDKLDNQPMTVPPLQQLQQKQQQQQQQQQHLQQQQQQQHHNHHPPTSALA